jgi:hypothetical protein
LLAAEVVAVAQTLHTTVVLVAAQVDMFSIVVCQ